MIKYLEIDSTYRNRQKWPVQALFHVDKSRQTPNDDPISDAEPIVAWRGGVIMDNTMSVEFRSSNSLILNGNVQTPDNYYSHAMLNPSGFRILSSKYLGSNKTLITVDSNSANLPEIGTYLNISEATDLSVGLLFVPGISYNESLQNFFIGKILYDETVNKYSQIVSYDKTTGCVKVSPAIPGWRVFDNFSIRYRPPIMSGMTAGVTLTNNTLIGVPEGFKDNFVRLIPIYPANSRPPSGETRQIVRYDSATNIATVYPPFSANPSGFKYEILEYTRPNYFPLTYSGTIQQDLANCTVRLLNLMLPNKILRVGYGGTPWDYPYLYVKLTPRNAINTNINCSNNPHSISTLFRAIPTHCNRKNFLKFTGDDATVRLRFIIDSDFMFEVTLPNGETLQYEDYDTSSPSRPNPLLQISCCFEILMSC